MTKEALKTELKVHIISYLNLLEMTPESIDDEALFFGDEMELDSIDSLEMIVLLEREYGIKIQDPKEGRKVLVNVNTMADYVMEHKKM